MRCDNIVKEEKWTNHPEELEPVCARNVRSAKAARREAGRTEAGRVINNAKAALARGMKCGSGKCPTGENCVNPSINDVDVSDPGYKLEAILPEEQPEDSDCEDNEKQYEVTVFVTFTLKAKCKCEEQAAENPIKYLGEPQKKVRTRKAAKRGTKKSAG